MSDMKLVIGKRMEDGYIQIIQNRFPWLLVSTCSTREEQEEMLIDADILFTRILPEDPSKYPRLKWVHFMWEGIDTISEDFRSSDVLLTNSRGIHARQVAEHVFMYMLAHSRKLFDYRKNQESRFWLPWKDQPLLGTLNGKTLGIVGYGAIGREVSRIAKGFNMHVNAVKKDPEGAAQSPHSMSSGGDQFDPGPDKIMGPDGLDQLLNESDHIVLALPLTDETIDMFGKREFGSMKKGAFFVNVGRGALVNEDELIRSLEEGHLSGAGLDVFREEPLPATSPLWSMENVIITPHSSVGGDPADELVVGLFCENLDRYLKGEDMINVVDKRRGY
ncbi:MAG: D-2-hydroxyacid dehydrogenase [Thermoplasmatota archaeon]